MAFYTSSTYRESVDGDISDSDPFRPIFGSGTTIFGTISSSDSDGLVFDVTGTGLEDFDHPAALPKGSTQTFSITVSGSGTFLVGVGDSLGNTLFAQGYTLTTTSTTYTGSFSIPNAANELRIYANLNAVGAGSAIDSYSFVIGAGGGGGSQPDFTSTGEGASATSLSPGATVYINGRVSNVGSVAGAPGHIGYYLSTDSTITTSDTFLGQIDQPGTIAAGGSIGLSTQVTIPSNLSSGTYYLGFIADYDGLRNETNNANNASAGTAITVLRSNRDPIANDDSVNTLWGTPVKINILQNDSDPDFDPLTPYVFSDPANGYAVVNPDRTITYTPFDNGFTGTDTFVYGVHDGRGGVDLATVTVNVTPGDRIINIGVLGGSGLPATPPPIPGHSTLTYKFSVNTYLTMFGDFYSSPSDPFSPKLFADSTNVAPTLRNGIDTYINTGDPGSNPRNYESPLMPGGYSFQIPNSGDTILYSEIVDRIVADEAGNASVWARALGVPQSNTALNAAGFVSRVDDVDYYTFTITQPSAVIVSITARDFTTPLTNPMDGAAFSRYFPTNSLITAHTTERSAVPLPAGTYTFAVFGSASSIDGFGDQNQYYQVYVSSWADDVGNTINTALNAGTINNSTYGHSSSVGIADPNDYYRISLTNRSVVSFNLSDQNAALGVQLQVLNAAGAPIGTDFGQAGGDVRNLTMSLDAGTYFVRAFTTDNLSVWTGGYGNGLAYGAGGAANYNLSISASTVPNGQSPNLNGGSASETILGDNGVNTIDGGGGNDTLYGFGEADTLLGNEGNDQLYGGFAADVLRGGNGNDILDGGPGADLLDGGAGVNIASYVDAVTGLYASLLNQAANTGDAAGDTYTSISGLIGSPYADILVGNGAINVLTGGEGDDTLYGFGASDELYGDVGTDQLYGGDGADRLDGGAGFDYARYDFSPSGVVVRLDYNQSSGGDAAGDIFVSIEGLSGSSAADFLFGNLAGNIIYGQAGNDFIYGLGGDDQLYGGDGSDQLIGGSGADYLSGNWGNDQFYFLASDLASGVWDIISDFGETGPNFDYVRFEGISASQILIGDNGGNAVITTSALNYSGGIVVQNFSGLQLLDQLIFA